MKVGKLLRVCIFLTQVVLCGPPWQGKCESVSCSVMSDSLWPRGLYNMWHSSDHNTGVGRLSLLQGIFSTQGSNPGLPYCRQIFYQLSHQGSPLTPSSLSNKESARNARDQSSIPVSGRSLGEGNGNLLWYPYLENSMDRWGWQAIVHEITKNRTWLSY